MKVKPSPVRLALDELQRAIAERDALADALRWYADTANWRQLETMGCASADLDRGKRARDALDAKDETA